VNTPYVMTERLFPKAGAKQKPEPVLPECRVTQYTVGIPGRPVYDEQSTQITITDEGAGEYIELSQTGASGSEARVRINPEEWPAIAKAAGLLAAACRSSE